MEEGFSFGVKHQAFNNEVRRRREELGMLQRELGELVGISCQLISRIETFNRYPTMKEAKKIAEVLQSDVETLFPEWLQAFKLKRSSFTTEHVVTERLLPHIVDKLALPDTLETTERKIDQEFLKQGVEDILDSLSDREAKVLRMRFGIGVPVTKEETDRLDDEKERSSHGAMTYEEVGRKFGVTRERIRQIEAKALRKLKHPAKRAELKKFINPEEETK